MIWRIIVFSLLLFGSAAGQAATAHVSAQQALVRMSMLLAADPIAASETAEADVRRWRNDPAARSSGELAVAHWTLANAQFRQGDSAQALATLTVAQGTAPSGPTGRLISGYVALLRGVIARGKGDFGQALQHYRSAQAQFLAISDQRGEALSLQSLGSLYADVGDSENAIRYLSLAQANYSGDDAFLMSLHNNLGVALQNAYRYREAIDNFRAALEIADRQGIPSYANWIRVNIASSFVQVSDYDRAAETIQAIPPPQSDSARPWDVDLLRLSATIALNRNNFGLARRQIETALGEIGVGDINIANRRTHFAAYQIYRRIGETQLALDQLEALRKIDELDAEITASNRAAVIAAQFQFAAQNARISRLQAEQLKRDVTYQRTLTWTISLGSILALGLLASLLILAMRSRNRARRDSAELAVVNERLERALSAKTEFLASTSHELRTPLNGILGMTQILLANSELATPLRSQIELVHDAGTTMRALVDDILDVAKIEHGGFVITAKPTDVRDLATRVTRLFHAQSRERGLDLTLETSALPAGLLQVDPDRITQILFNLVGNALKFTANGQVGVTLARVATADGAEQLSISVSDNGIGIAAEWHEAIFDMFRQVDGGRTRSHGGSGLGLAICRQLARAMGGDIAVQSAEGVGSTFTVSLPWIPVAEETVSATSLTPEPFLSGEIAIFAADPLRASMLQAILRHGGHCARIIDSPQQIAFLSSAPDILSLVDCWAVSQWLSGGGADWSGGPVVIVGEGGAQVPDSLTSRADRVAFARNAILDRIDQWSAKIASRNDISSLPQLVIRSNASAPATADQKRTRTMSGR